MNSPIGKTLPVSLALILGLPLPSCGGSVRGTEDSAAAPADTGNGRVARPDSHVWVDTLAETDRQPSGATPPIAQPPATARDTPPAGVPEPSGQTTGNTGSKVGQEEYEGWRQYSVNCARCHGQDLLPNPVAGNLLTSLGPGGPISSEGEFFQVVSEGRLERGMPAFKAILSPEQIRAIYAYAQGRAEKRIPPGRPQRPS
jgi:mono/diheme cytochrome c family protein